MYFHLSIGVGGNKSSIGKTQFIEKLIRFLKERFDEQIKITALKYTKTTFYSQIITESSIIEQLGKDTARMKKAGADFVYWIRATEKDLPEIAEKIKNELIFQQVIPFSHRLDSRLNFTSPRNNKKNNYRVVLIIEGNSLVRLIQPDVIIFFKDYSSDYIKPSGKAIFEIADLVIEGDYSMEKVMTEIENIQKKKFIYQYLKERSNNGKITCAEARKIAEELSVPYIEVGKVANELKIKICKCELGCF